MSTVQSNGSVVTKGLILYLDKLNPKSYTSGSLVWNNVMPFGYSGSIPQTASIYDNNFFKNNTGQIISNINLSGSQNCTISIWCNTTTIAFGQYFGTTFGGVGTDKFTLRGSNNASNAFQLVLGYLNTGSVAGSFFNGVNATPTNVPCNVTYTWDSGSNVSQYYNGVLFSQGSIGANFLMWNVIWPNFNCLPEYTSNIMIYNNRALTGNEVLQNYNALKGRFILP